MTRLHDEENSYEHVVEDAELVSWLKHNGAEEGSVYSFALEKGMGERLNLMIEGSSVVVHWYGTGDH